MDTAIKITQLPWTTVLTLASGYAGYFIAHLGARDHHKATDVTFGTLVFGFWGLFAYLAAITYGAFGEATASLLAMLVTVVLGGLWSVMGRKGLEGVVRGLGVSYSDDLPSAWAALGRQVGVVTYQLSVKTTDGVEYFCEDLHRFKDAPNGPCVYGGSGDILLYPTHIRHPNDEAWTEMTEIYNPDWGYEITFIPRDKIARVDIRRKKVEWSALFGRPGRG